jgi:hypothetical protein
VRVQTHRTMRFAPIENLAAELAVFDARETRDHTGATSIRLIPITRRRRRRDRTWGSQCPSEVKRSSRAGRKKVLESVCPEARVRRRVRTEIHIVAEAFNRLSNPGGRSVLGWDVPGWPPTHHLRAAAIRIGDQRVFQIGAIQRWRDADRCIARRQESSRQKQDQCSGEVFQQSHFRSSRCACNKCRIGAGPIEHQPWLSSLAHPPTARGARHRCTRCYGIRAKGHKPMAGDTDLRNAQANHTLCAACCDNRGQACRYAAPHPLNHTPALIVAVVSSSMASLL